MAKKTIEELEKYHLEKLKEIKAKKEKEKTKKLEPYIKLLKKYSNNISEKDLETMTNYIVSRFGKKEEKKEL